MRHWQRAGNHLWVSLAKTETNLTKGHWENLEKLVLISANGSYTYMLGTCFLIYVEMCIRLKKQKSLFPNLLLVINVVKIDGFAFKLQKS